MNSFRQHIPAYVEMDRPAAIPFETTADLLALEVVQRYKGPTFVQFVMDGNTLMEVSDDGYGWWVVGFIADPTAIDLPQWGGGKYLARLSDGREVTLTDDSEPHVTSSCGGRLSLSDGTEAIDVRHERQMAKQAADRALEDKGICARCGIAKVRTTAPDDIKGRKLTRIEDTCPQCRRRSTQWTPRC